MIRYTIIRQITVFALVGDCTRAGIIAGQKCSTVSSTPSLSLNPEIAKNAFRKNVREFNKRFFFCFLIPYNRRTRVRLYYVIVTLSI